MKFVRVQMIHPVLFPSSAQLKFNAADGYGVEVEGNFLMLWHTDKPDDVIAVPLSNVAGIRQCKTIGKTVQPGKGPQAPQEAARS